LRKTQHFSGVIPVNTDLASVDGSKEFQIFITKLNPLAVIFQAWLKQKHPCQLISVKVLLLLPHP
jgi:hypothetical protein